MPWALRICRNQLGDQVQALAVEVAGNMTVIAADVILLRRWAVEQAARLEEKLLDTHVLRQAVIVQIGKKIQLGVIAVDALDEGFEKTPLQTLRGTRAAQAQRGVDGQLALRQLLEPCIERIHPAIRLAQAQRQAEMEWPVDLAQYMVDGLLDGTQLRHLASPGGIHDESRLDYRGQVFAANP
ncbi:hypothetical protein D9M68_526510 [compost metagenome]